MLTLPDNQRRAKAAETLNEVLQAVCLSFESFATSLRPQVAEYFRIDVEPA
jgi:hypothetical protein